MICQSFGPGIIEKFPVHFKSIKQTKTFPYFHWLDLIWRLVEALDSLLESHEFIKSTIEKCTGSSHNIFSGKGDFFYVPKSEAKSFHHIGGLFAKHRLFLEFAIPLYMECFTNVKPLHLSYCHRYHPLSPEETVSVVAADCHDADVVHPVKLSHPKSWDIYKYVFSV